MYQQLILNGNVGKQPETRQVGEHTVTNVSVAVFDGVVNGEKRTKWFDVAFWNNRAGEFAAAHFKPGNAVLIVGQMDEPAPWIDAKTGAARCGLKVKGFSANFSGNKADSNGGGGFAPSEEPAPGVGTEEIPF